MKKLKVILPIVFIFFQLTRGIGQIDYTLYQEILHHHVSPEGIVDYEAIKSHRHHDFSQIIDQFSKTDPTALDTDAELAFWINAYNAYTIKLIIDHWPVSSIRDIGDGNPWATEWITILGQKLSLDQIEHEIIRKKFNEPRIHFAVNCAAMGCPPLLNEPFIAPLLERQLADQTHKFINNKKYNQISSKSVVLSPIFEWYEEDFGDLIEFLNKYSDLPIDSDASIRYMTYDWSLNN